MPRLSSGLIFTPSLLQHQVSVDMKFEPSVGLMARKVDKLGMDIRSFREPLKRIVRDVMIPSIRTNFIVGGRPAWQPLTEKTIHQKNGDDSPLLRTGALARVMSYQNTWTIDSEKAMITELPGKVWYGGVHQAGWGGGGGSGSIMMQTPQGPIAVPDLGDAFDEGSGAIPARPFVVVQPQDVDAMEEVMSDWLEERIRAAGLG